MKSKLAVLFVFGLILISHVANAQGRDQISVVGSSFSTMILSLVS